MKKNLKKFGNVKNNHYLCTANFENLQFAFIIQLTYTLFIYTNLFLLLIFTNLFLLIYYGATSEESKVRDQYIDEARFIRAYVYLVMVQQRGGVAIQKEMFSTGVMNHKRNSAEEVYDFIISELADLSGSNSKLLARKDAKGTNWGRANKEAAKMLLAKAYLCRGYESCAKSDDFDRFSGQYSGRRAPSSIPRRTETPSRLSSVHTWAVLRCITSICLAVSALLSTPIRTSLRVTCVTRLLSWRISTISITTITPRAIQVTSLIV